MISDKLLFKLEHFTYIKTCLEGIFKYDKLSNISAPLSYDQGVCCRMQKGLIGLKVMMSSKEVLQSFYGGDKSE